METRYFNHLSIHTDSMSITKTSDHPGKLIDEIVWYLDLPEELKLLTPDVRSFSLEADEPSLTMELIPGRTLGEEFVTGEWTRREWKSTFQCLRRTLNHLASYRGSLSKVCVYDMYISKTRQRMNAFLLQNDWARQVHKRGYFRLNGRTVMSPTAMLQEGMDELLRLLEAPLITVMHGDFCLSNLFYLPAQNRIAAIDPRGRFGIRTVYGDHRYDWAKLRHSLTGYEHIVRGRFKASIEPDSINLNIERSRDTKWIRCMLDEWLAPELQRPVRIIEALLFLSMLPLHKEDSCRQLALFALGTELLEQVLAE